MIKTFSICFALNLFVFLSGSMASTLTGGFPETLSGLGVTGEGRLVGDSRFIEFLSCFLDKSALNISWQAYPTSRVMRLVERGDMDISYPMGFDAERAAVSIQSLRVGVAHIYLVYVGAPPVLDDKLLTVGTKRGTAQASDFAARGFKSIHQNNDYFSLFKMLINGRLDMIAVPRIVYEYYAEKNDDKLNFQTYKTYDYGFYLEPNMDQGLVNLINNSITACRSLASEK